MRKPLFFILLLVFAVVLFCIDILFSGDALGLRGILDSTTTEHLLFMQLRLPRAITALLAGMALSVSGLQMQTLFQNPLAGPYVLGISSGASFGVAMLMVCSTLIGVHISAATTCLTAFLGALAVMILVLTIAKKIKESVTLLIVGMMISSIVSSLVNLLQYFTNPDDVRMFLVWTMGSLSTVGWRELSILAPTIIIGIFFSVLMLKPLNGMLLGTEGAVALGIDIRKVRFIVILATCLLAGGITAFCGPIAFVGIAVPHIARGLLQTSDHKQLLPATMLIGCCLMLLCDTLANMFEYSLPISTLTALFGAPIVIFVLISQKNHN